MANQLSPSDGGPIAGATAKQWIDNYQGTHPGELKAVFFGRNVIEQILAQPECIGMRIYFGQNETGEKKLILVGSKADGKNIWDLNSSDVGGGGGTVADEGKPCPPDCPPEE